MFRFFEDNINDESIRLNEENSHHYLNVLRIKEDEEVEVVTNDGIFKCIFKEIEDKDIILKIIEEVKRENESPVKLILFQGILKNDKMEQVLKQATEVGVTEIYPLKLKRVVADIDKKVDKKIVRWEKIIESAAKQSKRDFMPIIHKPITLKELNDLKGEIDLLVPYENEEELRLKDIKNLSNNIGLIIGPEGGFEEREIEELKEMGAQIITLGNRILRAETAAVCASFSIIYELESR
ncbi:RsmE family RNA methyltransferase [Peptoniphilus stercorisuis]|uniref:Ribosomal RNA small subunit methyltransferase E n=1 Tax=Peptoniphilus stercorisuis TaxID=1436965 RepID=A0ABS4KAH9_9FIRM|nr:RsmE family RNA methyltransferase [Peptoniphilus stercorisuis]MBP2024785.1 16S rRNA (uracil1498-N3)-methyltransferase [Peptoniphilus stercorisuis]